MMHAPPADEHLDDGALVRLIDGEAADGERAGVEAHLAACPVCAARLGSLRRRSVNLGVLLARGDFAVPAAPSDELAARREARRAAPRSWLRAAAVAALVVVGAGLFSSPVRAWFRDILGGAGSGASVATQPAPPPASAPNASSPSSGARIRFTPQGEEMGVEIAHPQAGSALVLERASSSTATAEVRAPVGALGDLLVLPTGLRIANRANSPSAAEYHVAVPITVQRVRVRIGTAPSITVSAAELARGRRIELR
ncbi:MAG TPA: zf-HC2 domain-containing protein [Longimicrobium sp.]|jgi:hypothetical protein